MPSRALAGICQISRTITVTGCYYDDYDRYRSAHPGSFSRRFDDRAIGNNDPALLLESPPNNRRNGFYRGEKQNLMHGGEVGEVPTKQYSKVPTYDSTIEALGSLDGSGSSLEKYCFGTTYPRARDQADVLHFHFIRTAWYAQHGLSRKCFYNNSYLRYRNEFKDSEIPLPSFA
nr:hypothetical protein CFP56_67765 [Quercus suber]